MIKIDKNIPIPPKRGRPKKYPFDEMEVGDSCLVKTKGVLSRRIDGKRFTTRTVKGGVRVWRVE